MKILFRRLFTCLSILSICTLVHLGIPVKSQLIPQNNFNITSDKKNNSNFVLYPGDILMSDTSDSKLASHYSHYSHRSHSSHYSHRSHYSSRY